MKKAMGGTLAAVGVASLFAFASPAKATEGTNLCVDGETIFVNYEDMWLYVDDDSDGIPHPLGTNIQEGECKKIEICHRNQGNPQWVIIKISENALPAHLAHQWGGDIYPVPENGCPVVVVETTTTIQEVPTTVQETTTTVEASTTTSVPGETTSTVAGLIVTTSTVGPISPPVEGAIALDSHVVAAQELPHTGRGVSIELLVALGLLVTGVIAVFTTRRGVNA